MCLKSSHTPKDQAGNKVLYNNFAPLDSDGCISALR